MSPQVDMFFLIFTLLSSLLFGWFLQSPAPFTKKDLLRALSAAASSSPANTRSVLIGYNTNLDVVLPDAGEFLTRLFSDAEKNVAPGEASTVDSLEAFSRVFKSHFASSSAGERFVSSPEVWNKVLGLVYEMAKPDDYRLGGNAALMSEAMVEGFGLNVELVGMAGKRMKENLNKKIIVSAKPEGKFELAKGEGEFDGKHDEIHLILEYPANSQFAELKSTRANRFIVSRDFSNGALAALDTAVVGTSLPDLVVVAGVHIMDGVLSKELRTLRLLHVKQAMIRSYAAKTRVHLEMGSTGDVEFAKEILETLVDGAVESIGLNEQELFSICNGLGWWALSEKSTLASAVPPVVKVQGALEFLFTKFPHLARIHFHSFAYHIVALRDTVAVMKTWPYASRAVASGSVIATTRACAMQVSQLHGNQLALTINAIKVSSSEYKELTLEFTPQRPVASWQSNHVEFSLAPVLACQNPKQTVGLGDYISAYALGAHLSS